MRRVIVILSLCVTAAAALRPALAQDELDMMPPEEQGLKRKKPSIFHRSKWSTPAKALSYAIVAEEVGHYRAAARRYRAVVHNWHESSEAVEAQQAYARMVALRGKYVRAFREYQYLVDHYAGDFDYERVLNEQFRIANLVRTTRRGRFFGLKGVERPRRALPLYEDLVENAPAWGETAQVKLLIGQIHEAMHDYELAVAEYEDCLYRRIGGELTPQISFARARCLYRLALRNPRDEVRYRVALSGLAVFLRDHPDHESVDTATAYLDELKDRLARMYFRTAEYYDRIAKRPASAVIAYSDFIKKFPTSSLAPKASRRLAELRARLASEEQKEKEKH